MLYLYFQHFQNVIISISSDYKLNEEHTHTIRKNYLFLVNKLDATALLGELYSRHVLTNQEKEDISSASDSFKQNERLLSVLSIKSSKEFQIFLSALCDCGQEFVASEIGRNKRKWKLLFFIFINNQIIVIWSTITGGY